ncbi:major facilitator superfamily domain-containing protein [Pseudomassariella vexata]|uniref:Major facilitator superfamily domain-containing protein n=1 Tax=Pseudomassariella vexata TaxID=1141098 RepID=A0A1Y2DJ70_9PEZI|nr:major facilitator superfamily domain-containing protein [Pseudomassariella vexata]ORY59184.1 major facilitator superfamily domain-containing protein [Pseudomassariella vexata]
MKIPSERGTSSPSLEFVDARAERRLLWKLDLCVLPILFIVYMMSFLDRINISNARIQGLTEELGLTGTRFNVALFVYFIPYILLEVPSNMILRKIRPSWYISMLMFCWGITNMCIGFVRSYEALVILRFFLGVFEAGVLPGIIYLISMYYKRHELQTRMSLVICSTLIAGAFGGLLAYAIAKLGGLRGYAAWRWIFIIEGAATAFIAIIATFLIVDWPEQCQFLSEPEKALLRRRLAEDGAYPARMDTLNRFAYKLIFSDWKIWLGSIMYMGIGTTGYATTFFMPTILLEFGWKEEEAQIRTMPVYAVSAAGMLIVAYLSDKLRHRYSFVMLGCFVSTAGYIMLLNQHNLSRDTKFAAVFLVCLGGYANNSMVLTWLANNVSGHWKRAFSSGIQITLGNIAGLIGTNIFLSSEAPRYPTGYGTALGMLWLGGISATALFIGILLENRKRDLGKRGYRLHQTEEEVKNMGDYHPSFRFTT